MPVGFCFSVRGENLAAFELNREYLAQQMKVKWPSVQFLASTLDKLFWSIPMMNPGGEYLVEGYQLSNHTVCLESPGSLENKAEFAIWLRSLVPANYTLVYWCTEDPVEVEIHPGMTEQQYMIAYRKAH